MDPSAFILFVDDEAGNRLAFKACFRRIFPVLVAEQAQEAMEMIRLYPVQMVLSDHRMPGLTGLDLFEILKQDRPEIVRILVSGSLSTTAREIAMEKGTIHQWIQKPWSVREVERTIRYWRPYPSGQNLLI